MTRLLETGNWADWLSNHEVLQTRSVSCLSLFFDDWNSQQGWTGIDTYWLNSHGRSLAAAISFLLAAFPPNNKLPLTNNSIEQCLHTAFVNTINNKCLLARICQSQQLPGIRFFQQYNSISILYSYCKPSCIREQWSPDHYLHQHQRPTFELSAIITTEENILEWFPDKPSSQKAGYHFVFILWLVS